MEPDKKTSARSGAKPDARVERLAAQLRANLSKRKAQSRARKATTDESDSGGAGSDGLE